MTENDIQKELNKDLLNFYNQPYEGELPKNVIELFRMAMFHVAPMKHQVHTIKIRDIFAKKVNELLFGEVGIVLKAIIETAPVKMYVSMEDFLKSQEVLEKLYIQYNSTVEDFSKRQERKRRSLIELGGASTKPLHIIRKN
jgi:hypothetical protein